jgi:hypothetical protein
MRAILAVERAFFGIEDPLPVRIIDHVVEVGQLLFLHELAQEVDVAVGPGIRRENVVIGDDDDPLPVPHLGVLAEFAFEDADRPGSAHIVRHQDVRFHPNVVARLHRGLAGSTGENFFRQRHKGWER